MDMYGHVWACMGTKFCAHKILCPYYTTTMKTAARPKASNQEIHSAWLFRNPYSYMVSCNAFDKKPVVLDYKGFPTTNGR